MDALLLACFAGFCLGVLSVGTRLALQRAPSVLSGSFVMNLGAFLVVSAIALVAGVSSADFDLEALWPFMVIGAVVPGTTQMLYVQAVRDAGASRTQVVMAAAPLVAAVLAVALLNESWNALLIVGTLLVVSGGMALAWDKRRPDGFRAVGILVALIVAILSGGRDTATRWILSETEVSAFVEAATALLAATVMAAVWAAVRRRGPLDVGALRAAALPFGSVAILMGASYAAFFKAFDLGQVTRVAPLIGTYALWSVALSALFLGRSEGVGRRLVASALLVVAGAALVSVGRGDDGRVTIDEAVASLAASSLDTTLGDGGPAGGVYVFATQGSEKIDTFLSPSHTYPERTVLSVIRSQCGYLERWTPLEGRTTERELCADADEIRLDHYSEVHTFLGSEDVRDYICSTDALFVPNEISLDARWSFTCDAGHTTETWSGGVVAIETRDPLFTGEVVHLRFETVLAGRTTGTSIKEFWLRKSDGLLLRESVVTEGATDTVIGDVHYDETYVLELTSTTPER